jgi:hypothetical protein
MSDIYKLRHNIVTRIFHYGNGWYFNIKDIATEKNYVSIWPCAYKADAKVYLAAILFKRGLST